MRRPLFIGSPSRRPEIGRPASAKVAALPVRRAAERGFRLSRCAFRVRGCLGGSYRTRHRNRVSAASGIRFGRPGAWRRRRLCCGTGAEHDGIGAMFVTRHVGCGQIGISVPGPVRAACSNGTWSMNHVRNSPPSPARRDAAERALYATGDVDTTDRIRAGFGLNLMMIATAERVRARLRCVAAAGSVGAVAQSTATRAPARLPRQLFPAPGADNAARGGRTACVRQRFLR
jgi:hypothetical protein